MRRLRDLVMTTTELLCCTNCGAAYTVATTGSDVPTLCPLCGDERHIPECERIAGPDEWVRIDDPEDEYSRGMPIYEGLAGDASVGLCPGRYDAMTRFGRACTVVVGRELVTADDVLSSAAKLWAGTVPGPEQHTIRDLVADLLGYQPNMAAALIRGHIDTLECRGET